MCFSLFKMWYGSNDECSLSHDPFGVKCIASKAKPLNCDGYLPVEDNSPIFRRGIDVAVYQGITKSYSYHRDMQKQNT